MLLTTLRPNQVRVGYGELGLHGQLGYESKSVSVQGQRYVNALSTHPPARVRYVLDGRFSGMRCRVALNDDVPASASHADFSVFADGRLVAAAQHVLAGAAPQTLSADLRGAKTLELCVQSPRWDFCHAVWLDPELEPASESRAQPSPLLDCLARAEILAPPELPARSRCIATVVSPGYTALLDDCLGSLFANGDCHDATVVVFALDADEECARVVSKYGATFIPCRSRARINATSKALLYSVARVVHAEQYVCLDADTLVLGSLRPLFAGLEVLPPGSILASREGNGFGLPDLRRAYELAYWGDAAGERTLELTQQELAYPLVVNDGVFAGSRAALLALDGFVRTMPGVSAWIDQRADNWWRNQFIFNLALARMHCGVELDATWNLQLHTQDVQWSDSAGYSRASWRDQPVRVLHFSGSGRHKYPAHKNRYAAVRDPLLSSGHGDSYADFVRALRSWLGRVGVGVMAWSFYGTQDGNSARIADASSFPLLGLLHYLMRSNGCTRVLETGTARGVSAACLASAVAHREGARVVTFDPFLHPERAMLWNELGAGARACIEERTMGSLEGMTAAIAAGERYDGALLDSIHSEEHVFQEFSLATQLVVPGGIIAIHDATYLHGTVDAALQRIRALGYDVTRLWTADTAAHEDDRLGLAIIENRKLRSDRAPFSGASP
jgi:predicted O-methyltransferase YrrM